MEVIIYGAGVSAERALYWIGYNRVKCFVVTEKTIEEFKGKQVISYTELLDVYKNNDNLVIAIASEKYYAEMEGKLKTDNLERYFVFRESHIQDQYEHFPFVDLYGVRVFKTYTELLASYEISQYTDVTIYGANSLLPYLILEVSKQIPTAKINIVTDDIYQEFFLGCKVEHIEKLRSTELVLINKHYNEDDIRHYIGDFTDADVIDLYYTAHLEKKFEYPGLQKFKDFHKGKRCFIVATGPSLRIEDLETLHLNREICISVNKIYRCYDQTNWRADYIGMSDPRIIEDVIKDMVAGVKIPGTIFMGDNYIHLEGRKAIKGVEYFHLNYTDYLPNMPLFSEDVSICSYNGCTVTYDFAIQMAAYMGFEKIYLLGVDHGMSGKISDAQNHFIPNYYREDEKSSQHFTEANWDGATRAYEAAEVYSRKHGFRIFNATRGGKLEAFERVDFDDLF